MTETNECFWCKNRIFASCVYDGFKPSGLRLFYTDLVCVDVKYMLDLFMYNSGS